MAKKITFFCSECGYEQGKWSGQCPQCKSWNTFVEAPKLGKNSKDTFISHISIGEKRGAIPITQVDNSYEHRIVTAIEEFDRVLGGGIVEGSLTLLGGDPGIGKSTLLMQAVMALSEEMQVLYVSGEESASQIKMRAARIGKLNENLLLYCDNDIEKIAQLIIELKTRVVVIDSIQTMSKQESISSGSLSQIKESTNVLVRLAKEHNVAIFVVGHVTKDGAVAGPKVLEHMVDTVLYFEGDKNASYRILRSVKNRFGATNEIGVFTMEGAGLKEVTNPSEFMLSGRPLKASGSAITCSMEGTRPILMEIQALVIDSVFQMPRRTATGVDYNRVNLLMAVLEKRAGIRLLSYDAYVNITGGFKINEPACDLAIVLSIASAYKNIPIDPKLVVFGEVGLSGEVRGVNNIAPRVKEAIKLGFDKIIIPKSNFKEIDLLNIKDKNIIPISYIEQSIDLL